MRYGHKIGPEAPATLGFTRRKRGGTRAIWQIGIQLLPSACIFLLASMYPAEATPITYIEEFTATGSLGTSTFTNADLRYSFTGDTENVVTVPCNCRTPDVPIYENTTGTTTVSVSGIGTAMFTNPAGVFSRPDAHTFGFSGTLYNSFLSALDPNLTIDQIFDAALGNYDLTTFIGPIAIAENEHFSFITDEYGVNTTTGLLNVTAISGGPTFTAIRSESVPEPASLPLFAAGLVVFGIACRRQRRRSR